MYEKTIAPQESAPANFEPFYEIARLHARSGSAEGDRLAREFFARAQALQPAFTPIVRELAALDYRQGDLASAEKSLKALTDKDPSDVGAAIDLALVRRRLGQGAQAEKAISEQLAGKADGLDAARWLEAKGVLLEDRGDFQGASVEYRKAVEIDPESAELKLLLAFALVRTGQAGEARAMADQILTSAGDSRWLFAAVSRLRAEADIQEGRIEPAIEQMLRAVEIDQKDALLLERAGILLEKKGDQVAAYELLRRASSLAAIVPTRSTPWPTTTMPGESWTRREGSSTASSSSSRRPRGPRKGLPSGPDPARLRPAVPPAHRRSRAAGGVDRRLHRSRRGEHRRLAGDRAIRGGYLEEGLRRHPGGKAGRRGRGDHERHAGASRRGEQLRSDRDARPHGLGPRSG